MRDRRRIHRTALAAALLLAGGFPPAVGAQPLGSAFTYQGQLTESGQPASGLYDLQACLFDTPSNPVPIACAPDFADVPVAGGVFALALDFGTSPFVGQQRFIELRVRPGASTGGYTILTPRQPVRPVPESLRAGVASAAPWSGLSGVPAGFADGVDNEGGGGTVTSISAGTGLTGGTITDSGTLGIANGGVGSAQIADGAIAAVDVAPDALGAAQIASNGVGAAELADNAVDTAAVQNQAITQPKIASGAVGTAQIAAGAVGLAQVDTAQVQVRIGGTCALGSYLRGIQADGMVLCSDLPGVNTATLVDGPPVNGTLGRDSAIAIGADGLPIITYYDGTTGAVKVVQCGNAACASGNRIAALVEGGSPDIAIGADGRPVISYYDFTALALRVMKCGRRDCQPNLLAPNIATTVDDPGNNNVAQESSIAIGADGFPVISYPDVTAGTLKVAKCGNASCTGSSMITTVDDPANAVGRESSIAIGMDGFPVISYWDSSAGTLKVAKCSNAACSGGTTITTVDDPANFVGRNSSIAIGADGLPVISYQDVTASALKVLRCGDPACTSGNTITTVDDPPGAVVATATSIAIGTDGLPLVCYPYLDLTSFAIKVVRCGGAACSAGNTITTVTAPDYVYAQCAMTMGTDGLPVLSYAIRPDNSGDGLAVTKCGSRSCR